jgi:hypothetical protein
MMRTLDHAVEEEFSRSQFPSEEEEEEEEEEYSLTHFPSEEEEEG